MISHTVSYIYIYIYIYLYIYIYTHFNCLLLKLTFSPPYHHHVVFSSLILVRQADDHNVDTPFGVPLLAVFGCFFLMAQVVLDVVTKTWGTCHGFASLFSLIIVQSVVFVFVSFCFSNADLKEELVSIGNAGFTMDGFCSFKHGV